MKMKKIQKITLVNLQFSPDNSKLPSLFLKTYLIHVGLLVFEREILLLVQSGKFIPLGKLLLT